MEVFKSSDEILRDLARAASDRPFRYIGVDGYDGAGKTRLARMIANRIGATVVSLDEYVEEGRGGYVPYLRIADIKATMDGETRPVVLEGVCLLAAAERIGIGIDALVYVKRMSTSGMWTDESECSPWEPVEAYIQQMKKNIRFFAELDEEIVRYHATYKPMDRAQYVLERTGF
ncbi:MAG: hypothetical protein IT364_27860 [Candidatus Hydrogenedentes bacterium]|nr:hypothetical protein [Candidatus Hydrogenedentota bacterium]